MDIIYDAGCTPPTEVAVTTFGYLHGAPPPDAHVVIDLRTHYCDPHVSPKLRYLTARDAAVRTAVLNTSGIQPLISAIAATVLAYLSGPSGDGPVRVAIGCAGGRHRAAVVGMELTAELTELWGVPTILTHRDLHRPVIDRPADGPVSHQESGEPGNQDTSRSH